MTMVHVYVIETGDYDQRFISAISDSVESAVDLIKSAYGSPYIVAWESLKQVDKHEWGLLGHFQSVHGYSTKHDEWWSITRYPIRTKLNSEE